MNNMKKFPETSLEAFESMTGKLLSAQHYEILKALLVLDKATAEEISIYLNWEDKNRSSRRMSELERDQKIFKPGEKRKTKSGRNAFVYQLVKTY
jgi:predicted transcriptional regulator